MLTAYDNSHAHHQILADHARTYSCELLNNIQMRLGALGPKSMPSSVCLVSRMMLASPGLRGVS